MIFTCTLLAASLGAADGGFVFPPELRAREEALVKSFGLQPPDGGVLLPVTAPGPDPRWLLVPARWHREKTPQRVDIARLRDDLSVLNAALEQGYAGYERALKRGWRWPLWFKEWDTALEEQSGTVPLTEAFALFEQYQEFQPDSLSGVVGAPNPWRSLTSSLEKAPKGTCYELETTTGRTSVFAEKDPALQPRAVDVLADKGQKLERGWMLAAPEALGLPKVLRCAGGDVEAFSAWNPPSSTRLAMVKALGGMDGAGLRELEPRVWWMRPGPGAADYSRLPKDAVLLVDLRQLSISTGGPELLKALGAPADLPSPLTTRRTSCGAAALRVGALQASELIGPPRPLLASQPVLSALEPGACRPDAVEKSGGPLPKGGRKKPSLKPRPGRRVVALLDNGCEGSCELLAFQLSLLPDVILAGTATAGRAEYTEPGRLVLPRTRIPLRVALTRRDFFGDGRSFDGYGLPPDVLIEDEAGWSPESLRAFARKLLPPAPK